MESYVLGKLNRLYSGLELHTHEKRRKNKTHVYFTTTDPQLTEKANKNIQSFRAFKNMFGVVEG